MGLRRWLLATILLGSAPMTAQAAPFSFDPVSFAGYANSRQQALGNDLFFKNLGLCSRKGDKGYNCLEGELLKRVPGKSGRSFCTLRFVGFHPKTRNINYLIKSCEYRDDRRRLIDQSQQLLRKGLDTLENFSK